MDAETIIRISLIIVAFLVTTLIPTIIALVKKWKKASSATTDADKLAIINEMIVDAQKFVVEAEEMYSNVSELMKQQTGATCGALKKDGVMSKLQRVATEKGIAFDAEFWSNVVDNIVAMTKKVNK